ncbi:ArsR/SmtB family transcription factor [Sphaerisporangium aureirubrum]|uniref:Helix-turn-helix domain-containing protein n=1 Tax=Sphaerisporangium aureirubrum TaxID=1544736 RepID=A0ABW1NTN4_9ACTN
MDTLENRLAALERRVERLEQHTPETHQGDTTPRRLADTVLAPPGDPAESPTEKAAGPQAADTAKPRTATRPRARDAAGDTAETRPGGGASLRLLDRMREHIGARGEPSGRIAYVGAAGLDSREYLWAREHEVSDLIATDRPATAAMLECLGSPARLALLTALTERPRTRAELQEALGETSTGHLYHHLRELQSAGLLVQRRRGEYELAPHALIPLLTVIAATHDLTANADRAATEAEG